MSGGFTFGNKTTVAAPTFGAPSGGSITFGTPAPQQPAQAQFGFGNVSTPAPTLFGTPNAAAATGFKSSFGTPAPTQGGTFGLGAAGSTPGGFGFGTPTQNTGAAGLAFGTPASSAATGTGLSFGAPSFGAPATASFGTPASTGLSFGTPTSTAAALNFGAATPAAAPAFGAGAAAPTFGTPASAAPGFGAPAAAASTFGTAGSTFGTPAASTGLSFGTATTSAPLGFGIGAQAPSFGLSTPASTGLSFGAVGTQPTTSAPGGFSISTSTAPAAGLSFGITPASSAAAATTGGLSFGPTSTAAPSFGLTTTTAPALGLSFGTATTAAPTLGFGLGGTTSTSGLSFGQTPASTSAGLSFGLGGLAAPATATTATFSLTPTTSAPPNVGLGGIVTTQSKAGTTSAEKEIPPKEQPLPNEFLQTVESFKNFVQAEKNRSSDIARCSLKEFHKVETDLDVLTHQFGQVENQLAMNMNLAEQLKLETAKGLQNIEMAHRTQETPPALQYDNTAPLHFFLDLADKFEKEMQALKIKIDNTEKFVKKWNEPAVLTSQDLAMGIRRLHETFVALAGRMQSLHSQVENQKETFLSLRKQAMKDNVNPFEKPNKNAQAIQTIMKRALKTSPPKFSAGPTPFNNILPPNPPIGQQQNPPPYPTTTTTPSAGFGAPAFGTQSSLFKSPVSAQPFQLNATSNFQLQRPPTGHKRGKQ